MPPSAPPPFIIDSHIHLWDTQDRGSLAWLTPSHTMGSRACDLDDYVDAVNDRDPAEPAEKDGADATEAAAAAAAAGLRVGYVFIETDRKNGGDGSDWTQALAEVAYVRRLIEAEAKAPASRQQARCLAIVPWAPVHSGPAVLERYLDAVKETAGPLAWPRVRGFRYLVQDKPHGTMLTDDFVASLRLLGRRHFTFDLGIDQHRRGRTQMNEALQLVERVHGSGGSSGSSGGGDEVADDEKVVLVINHMAKPDITVLNPAADRGFDNWRSTMYALGKASPKHVYMKLSGLFSEMPSALRDQPVGAFFAAVFQWLAVLLTAFGPSRLMFASDWPVCTIGFADAAAAAAAAAAGGDGAGSFGPTRQPSQGEAHAWDKWRSIVAYLCYMATLSADDEAMIWAGTAVEAYGLDLNKD